MTPLAILVEHNGQQLNLTQLSQAIGVPAATLSRRYSNGDRDARLKRAPEAMYKRRGKLPEEVA